MPLVLRSVKNAELTWPEVDGNFLYLENKIDDLEQLFNGDEVVKVTEQTFLPEQQAQARANMYAADVGTVRVIGERVEDIENLELVLYAEQAVTEEQKQFLRNNAGVYSKIEVDNLTVARTIKNITVTAEGQNIIPDANKTIVRFNSVFSGCRIREALNNGDELALLNKATTERAFNIEMRVVLQTGVNADVFAVLPNKNYMFWFEKSINRWIDVSL